MKKIGGDNLKEVVDNFVSLKRHRPYQFSGKWFIAYIKDQGYAYTTLKGLQNKAAKVGLESFEYYQIGA